MISGLFIFSAKGEILTYRIYRPDIRRSIADTFRVQVINNTKIKSPILSVGRTTFCHILNQNVYFVAVSKVNVNVALVFELLYRIISLCNMYFGSFEEETVKNNFPLIYELFDEILDFGFPQNTDPDTVKLFITSEEMRSAAATASQESSKITMQATGAISWRRPDIKYKKNELFIDVIESVNLLMSVQGNILRADVNGKIVLKSMLSGNPECKLGLNERVLMEAESTASSGGQPRRTSASRSKAVEIEDYQFHQCVRLGKFEHDKTISFIPPDGEFELMKYRTTENISLAFKLIPIVREIGKTSVEYKITLKSNYPAQVSAQNVIVTIPTPLNTANAKVHVPHGKAKYVPGENAIIWKMFRCQGASEFTLTAVADLVSTNDKKIWAKPPISIDFQVLMFTSSGLMVRFLKVFEKSNYNTVKWVRYMTKAGSYQFRF